MKKKKLKKKMDSRSVEWETWTIAVVNFAKDARSIIGADTLLGFPICTWVRLRSLVTFVFILSSLHVTNVLCFYSLASYTSSSRCSWLILRRSTILEIVLRFPSPCSSWTHRRTYLSFSSRLTLLVRNIHCVDEILRIFLHDVVPLLLLLFYFIFIFFSFYFGFFRNSSCMSRFLR